MKNDLHDNGHLIRYVGEGELAYCDRCKGGEVELDEPCAVRLHRELNAAQSQVAGLRSTIEIIGSQNHNLECPNCAVCQAVDKALFSPAVAMVPYTVCHELGEAMGAYLDKCKTKLEEDTDEVKRVFAAVQQIEAYAPPPVTTK